MKRFLLFALAAASPLHAHDTWLELNTARAAAGQAVYVDLMLGNHGNHHRDFLLDSKIPLAGSTLALIPQKGAAIDLKPLLIDRGSDEKDGFWTAKFQPAAPGLYCIAHTYDAVVSYAPKRAIKSAKTYLSVGEALGNETGNRFSEALGYPLEIVPASDPTQLKAGDPLSVSVLFKGKPLAGAVVSCIPRGSILADEFDPAHESKTDADGRTALALPEANYYLVVVHLQAPEETGEKYSAGTEYGASLVLMVGAK